MRRRALFKNVDPGRLHPIRALQITEFEQSPFIRYPGMDPTNNESERMLRKVVIHRKIRQKLVTIGGKIMFGTIMTCLLTWDKQGLNWFEKLSEVFWTT